MSTAGKRNHKAAYARDKRKGGYIIRVEGPKAGEFAGRTVPVTKKDGDESMEDLTDLIWTGNDTETGKPVALYNFTPKVRGEEEEAEF